MKKGNVKALLPHRGVSWCSTWAWGFLFEYGLKIPMGFYSIPIVVVFLIAPLCGLLPEPSPSLGGKADPHGQRRGR